MSSDLAAHQRCYQFLCDNKPATAGKKSWKQSAALAPLRGLIRAARSRRQDRELSRVRRLLGRMHVRKLVFGFPEFHGEFEVAVDAELVRRIAFTAYESHIARLFAKVLQPGDQVVDIGANIGMYTVLASHLVGEKGRVLAAEPVPTTAALFRLNLSRNARRNVEFFQGAATSEAGPVTIHVAQGGEEYSSLGNIAHPNAPSEQTAVEVEGDTLDHLCEKNNLQPTLVKIDVEGAEGLVLSGAQKVFENYRPVLVSELDDRLLAQLGWKAQRVLALLEGFGYRVFDADTSESLSGDRQEPFTGDIVAIRAEACDASLR